MTIQLRLSTKPVEKGVVYTKPWVVDLILDFVGYRHDAELTALHAVEPAAGEGAFLGPMVRRLAGSMRRHGRSLDDARSAIRAYEIDSDAADFARQLVVDELVEQGFPRRESIRAAGRWIVQADYLLSPEVDGTADIIVGNPPYIRYDDLADGMFSKYQAVCPTMVGRCDIYVAFIEMAVRQLKPGGRMGFICADRWMRSAYGTELRRFVAKHASVETVIEMHDAPAFEDDVAAYPAVTIIRRGSQGPALVGSATQSAGAIEDGSLADAIVELAGKRRTLPGFRAANLAGWYPGDTPWPWAEPQILDLLRHLEERCRPLEDAETGTKIGIGVATGADQVFITTDTGCVEADRLLPLAMAYDAHDGTVAWSGHYLVDPWGPNDQLVDLAKFPKLADYFTAHAAELKHRNIASRHRDGWYRTIDRVTHSLLVSRL
jgi:adenine-specific DNA-methyltransferase